jgi:hypothetical protein
MDQKKILDDRTYVEKFTAVDLLQLRGDLMQAGIDSFQAADMVTNFLSGRGYGVAPEEARGVVSLIDCHGCTADRIQAALEGVARAA